VATPLTADRAAKAECQEHEWRTGPIVHMDMRRQAVCIRCWLVGTVPYGSGWPEWTDQDYEDNKEDVETKLWRRR
jgi:hypothetical protein